MRIVHLMAACSMAAAALASNAQAQTIETASPVNAAVQYGEHPSTIAFVRDSSGHGVSQARVDLSATCGTLNPISTISGSSGYVFIEWTAPSGPVGESICYVSASLSNGSSVTFGKYLPGAGPI